jgi:hypothetical protein
MKKKKGKKSLAFTIIIIGLALLSGAGAAGYIYSVLLNHYKATAENRFYFTSDLLREGPDVPVYDIYYDWTSLDDTVPITIELRNSESALNVSSVAIAYTVKAAALSSGHTGVLPGNTESREAVTLNVPCGAKSEPFEVTVTATSDSPYRKTLTGRFVVRPLLSYAVDDNQGSPVARLTISLAGGPEPEKDVLISWGEGAEPDMTNPAVISASVDLEQNTMRVRLNTASVYELVFFKDDPSVSYSDVTVLGTE